MDVRGPTLTFGQEHFGTADLGDRRRTNRLVQTADAVLQHPGGTLPEKVDDPAALKGLYRLMNSDSVTHERVLTPEMARTRQRMADAVGTVLVPHDWTELDYSGLRSLAAELGPIGNGRGRGYLCVNALAVLAETREVLGLAYQKLAKRPRPPQRETRSAKRARRDRETRLWREASRHIPPPPAGRRQVEVADRGADLLEFLDFVEAQGKSYLVRSKHNRRIQPEHGPATQLHDLARQWPEQGRDTTSVGATATAPERQATVALAWGKVTLLVPKQPRGETRQVPLTTWVVRVWEVEPPAGVAPLEWILLTNVPVATSDDARERVGWYEVRWVIEEYHKALKTGCSVEQLQFTSEAALRPTIAVLSVVAVALLNLRDASRRADAATRPAVDLFPALWVTVLSRWRYRSERRDDLRVQEFFYALARLGGHQNRKHDHRPGWLVLWRGWTKLQAMVEAASLLDDENSG